MRHIPRIATVLAAALSAVAMIAAPAGAAQLHRHPAAFWQGGKLYVFKGTLAADAGAAPTSISVNVSSGNRAALRALVGSVNPVTFAVAPGTRYIAWSAASRGNAPAATTASALHAGDAVYVRIRAHAGAPLAQVAATPAVQVGDTAAAQAVAGRMFAFWGRATSIDTAAQTITLTVRFGNWAALNALLGESPTQTFHYDPATQFLNWRGGPHTVTADQVKAGDWVTLRTRASWSTPLAALVAAPLWKVNDHMPRLSVNALGATVPVTS
jgi:hypothetical protein